MINAGGVLQLLGLEALGWDEDELERNLAGIGATLRELYGEADAAQITPSAAAERLVERRLAAGGADGGDQVARPGRGRKPSPLPTRAA